MSSPYKFDYADVSVYACAVELISRYAEKGGVHVDLGCGYAAISKKIKELGVRYLGFDANAMVVAELRDKGVDAHEIDLLDPVKAVEKIVSVCAGAKVTTLSMLDVIEHLGFDCEVLSALRKSLPEADSMTLIASIPNFSHFDVAAKLFAGRWEYTESGLLDKTHNVVYTEQHLRQVMRSHGWHEVDGLDYRQEYSDQYFVRESVVLNRAGGVGRHLRKLKEMLDRNADVHQFVRAYRAGPDLPIGRDVPSSVALSILVADESALEKLCEQLEVAISADGYSKLEVVLVGGGRFFSPQSIERLKQVSPELQIAGYEDGAALDFDGYSQLSGKYWLYFNSPLVGGDYLCCVLEELSREGEGGLIWLSPVQADFTQVHEAAGLTKLLVAPAVGLLFPTDYVRQFEDFPELKDAHAWQDYVLRVALRAGIHPRFVAGDFEAVGLRAESKLLVDVLECADFHLICGDIARQKYNSDLSARDERIAVLQQELDLILGSRSWSLTRPLRWLFRQLERARREGGRAIVRDVCRSIYIRVPLLRSLRMRYLAAKAGLLEISDGFYFSESNLKALQDLTAKRFIQVGGRVDVSGLVDKPEIDVSVVTYNSARWVSAFFESLLSQSYPLEKINVFIVDHGSKDETLLEVEKVRAQKGQSFCSFNVISQDNLGFGAGHDRAIREGRAPFCLVANVDLEFSKDSVSAVVAEALGDAASRFASWEFRQAPYEHPKYYDPVTLEVNWSSHACILLRRSAYEAVGGYDRKIFMYGEDVELSYRFRSYGYALRYVPKAVVLHHTYASANEVKPLQFSGSVLGNAYIRIRYGGWKERLGALLMYCALFFRPMPFAGARKLLLANLPKLFTNYMHFLKGKGPAQVCYPFRGFDYEMVREGAFCPVSPVGGGEEPPLVSVIVRTYRGREKLLRQALESVFNQTYPAIEVVVAEDGGDTQRAVVAEFSAREREGVDFVFVPNDKVGRSAVGNAAMGVARGEYFMFLDDDDLLFADHVEVLISKLRADPGLSAAYALAFEVLTDMAEDKSCYVERVFQTPDSFRQEWDYSVMRDHNFIPIQSIVFRRELFDRRGGFDTDLDQLEDWNLWLRYGLSNKFSYVPKTTSLFRTPADMKVRMSRHSLLHDAYVEARRRADERLSCLSAESG